MRTSIWLAALAPHARVALVAPPGRIPAGVPPVDYFPAARSWSRGLRALPAVLGRGLPFQSLLAAPYRWPEAIAAARAAGAPFDAVVMMLTRIDPWVRDALEAPVVLLDAIDSLRRNAEERGRAAGPLARLVWRAEERRLARAEREAAQRYDRIVVVSSEETTEFAGAAVAAVNSVPVAPLDAAAPRQVDFGFWGRLGYFANADAARLLLEEIWPRILERRPSSTLALGGADVPPALRRLAERRGVVLLSPVPDIAAFARSIRVAIIPMRYGSGQLSKVLEAAEAGCAIVATPQALRGLDPLRPHVALGEDAASLADAALRLIDDEPSLVSRGLALRRVVESTYARDALLTRLATLAGVAPQPAGALAG